MCGICGFAGFEDSSLLKRMIKTLQHRGPDDSGTFFDKNISLGHTRLSIIDLSKAGHQPMSNEQGNIWISFNGEIYNHRELRAKLEKKHKYKSKTDTETIIHQYEQEPKTFLQKLNGMYALAIYDSKQKKLTLARDKIGIKPLYYAFVNDGIIFASEIKALLECKEIGKKLNKNSVDSYLVWQCVPGNETILERIFKLEPGCFLEFEKGKKARIQKYWEFTSEIESGAIDSNSKLVQNAVEESIERQLMSDVPLGVFLSGGIDSSIVAASVRKFTQNIKTFSAGFNESDDELEFARLISEFYGTNHEEFYFSQKDLMKNFEDFVWHLDEPLADSGAVPTFLLSKQAKKQVSVVLTGEGADELFAGYRAQRLMAGQAFIIPQAAKLKAYFYLNTFANSRKLSKLAGRNVAEREFQKFKNAFLAEKAGNILDKTLAFEIHNNLPNNLLMKVDKTTMASALEARVPFLDDEVVKLASEIPSAQKASAFEGKLVLKKAFKNRVPEKVLKRKKHGFIVPWNSWFKQGFKEFAEGIVLDSRNELDEVLDLKGFGEFFKQDSRLGRTENESLAWRLTLLKEWCSVFLD